MKYIICKYINVKQCLKTHIDKKYKNTGKYNKH